MLLQLTADQEERSNRIDQLQTEMMAGQGPDIFILPCDDGFGFNETRLIENVEKGMVTGLFADLSQLYDQDETLEKDLLLEKVMDAGMMDGKRYILPLRYQYPIILALEDELQGAGLDISELAQNSETFLSTVIAQEGNAWHVSGANVFAANLSNVFPSLCDYNTGEVYLDEETLTDTLSQYMELLSTLDQESIEADGVVWPYYLSPDRPLDTLFLSDDLFMYLDVAYAQYQELVAAPFAAQDGSIVANVSYYGAVSANCAAVEEAYEFLKLLLSKKCKAAAPWNTTALPTTSPLRNCGRLSRKSPLPMVWWRTSSSPWKGSQPPCFRRNSLRKPMSESWKCGLTLCWTVPSPGRP